MTPLPKARSRRWHPAARYTAVGAAALTLWGTAQGFVPPSGGRELRLPLLPRLAASSSSVRSVGSCSHSRCNSALYAVADRRPKGVAGKPDIRPPSQRKDTSPFDPLALKEGQAVEAPQDDTIYKAMLLLVAVIWGSNFGALKYLDTCGVDVSVITAIRFALATLSLLPFLLKASKEVLFAGLEVGLWVSLGYITQAVGLETTEASKSAFICSLTVVLVPLIQGLMGRKIPPQTWVSCALAVAGVGLLTLQGTGGPVIGDLWSMGQPIGFGTAFMRIEHYMARQAKGQALPLAAGQMLSVLLCATVWAAFSTGLHMPDISVLGDPAHAAALVYTGVVTSALAVVLESIALAFVSATETAVIFSTEPLWAAATSAVFLGERLKPLGILGGATILSACLLTQADLSSVLGPVAEESSKQNTPLE